MTRIWAIAKLTFQEGIRMRIVLVFVMLLVFLMIRLPFALQGDDTLAGRLQNFLSYSLGAVSLLLSLATIFISCASVAGELRTKSIQMVVSKPVGRFEIVMGKWLGANLLTTLLLVLSAVSIYSFAVLIRGQKEENERDRMKVRDVVWIARQTANPVKPDFTAEAEKLVDERIEKGELTEEQKELAVSQTRKSLEGEWLSIEPGYSKVFEFEGLRPPRNDQVTFQVRFKARGTPIPSTEELPIDWFLIDPVSGIEKGHLTSAKRQAIRHEFMFRAAPIIRDGKAAIMIGNPNIVGTRSKIYFVNPDDLEILYEVGGFLPNYLKAVFLVFCLLAFLSAVGVFFSTFVSFPVACFCTVTFFLIGLARPWWLESIGANMKVWVASVDPFGHWGPAIRTVLEPLVRVLFPDFTRYDGGAYLVDGVLIPGDLVLEGALRTLGAGVIIAGFLGWLTFRRREVAEVVV
ncbi:MAG: ABC transporter permease [Phycisphaerales bacterium]|nr:ABC transporter permease [Phycisphaerales bacterium]